MKVYRVSLIDMNGIAGNGGWISMLLSIGVLALNALLMVIGTLDLLVMLAVHGIMCLYRNRTPEHKQAATPSQPTLPMPAMSPVEYRKPG